MVQFDPKVRETVYLSALWDHGKKDKQAHSSLNNHVGRKSIDLPHDFTPKEVKQTIFAPCDPGGRRRNNLGHFVILRALKHMIFLLCDPRGREINYLPHFEI